MEVEVYDISGKLLNQFIVPSEKRFTDFDSDEVGIRILKWSTDDNVAALRIVKLQ